MYTVLIVFCCFLFNLAFFGLCCSKLAIQRNKNDLLAAFMGMFFGVFALLYYGLSLKEEEKDEEWFLSDILSQIYDNVSEFCNYEILAHFFLYIN